MLSMLQGLAGCPLKSYLKMESCIIITGHSFDYASQLAYVYYKLQQILMQPSSNKYTLTRIEAMKIHSHVN